MGKLMTSMMTGFAVVFVAGLSVGWAQRAVVHSSMFARPPAAGPQRR